MVINSRYYDDFYNIVNNSKKYYEQINKTYPNDEQFIDMEEHINSILDSIYKSSGNQSNDDIIIRTSDEWYCRTILEDSNEFCTEALSKIANEIKRLL